MISTGFAEDSMANHLLFFLAKAQSAQSYL
jgi:hypothetical protein